MSDLKRIIIGVIFCCVSTLGHAVMPATGLPTQQAKAAGIIVKMRNDATPTIIADAGGHPRLSAQTVEDMKVVAATSLTYKRTASLGTHVLNFTDTMTIEDAQAVAELLMTMPDVELAVPNLIHKPMLTPNDPRFVDGTQWSLNNPSTGANLPAAWDTTTGVNSVVIAVLDTGYTNHSELAYGNFATEGYDFITNTSLAGDGDGRDSNARDEGDYCLVESSDSSWHGTAVMSIIGAITNNNTLMAGVNWNAKMIPLRVLGRCGGTTDDIIDAIRWAAGLTIDGVPANPNPAKIINMSLGGIGYCDEFTQAAVNDAHAAGAVLIAAAGNFTIPAQYTTPANCQNVMSIAAHVQDGDIAFFSNYGAVDLSAPGVDIYYASCGSATIYSCDNSTFMEINQGTSFSAPLVSGVASLIYALDSTLNNYYVEQILRESARPFLTGSSCVNNCGAGMLDAAAALALIPNFMAPAERVAITKDGGGADTLWFWLSLGLLAAWSQRNRKR